MIDTVRLHSPAISEETARAVAQLLTRRSAVKLSTGEVQYEFTSESLVGSYDARVMVQVKREAWVSVERSRVPVCVPCEPFLVVETSIHKQMLGHNVYGGPTSFQRAAKWFVAFLSKQMGAELPPAEVWTVERVDVAECFSLGYEAVEEYITSLNSATYPRRKVIRYGSESIFAPGTTTATKAYHKGIEFAKHDSKRLRAWMEADELEGLQVVANGILRVETEIKSKKLQAAYEKPLVGNVTDEWLAEVHDREVVRLLKEGKSDMDTVRTTTQVKRRLYEWYPGALAGTLYATWMVLASLGEEEARRDMPKRTWYRHKKQLMEAGCAWSGANVLTFETVIPEGFAPVRSDPRRLIDEAYEVSAKLEPYTELVTA